MICKFCGNVIDDNSDFCFICGQKVSAEVPAYAVPEENTDVFSQPQQAAYTAPVEAQPAPAFVQQVAQEQQAAPVYAQQAAPVYAQQAAPVYAQQPAPQYAQQPSQQYAPQAAQEVNFGAAAPQPVAEKKPKKVKVKDPNKSKGLNFLGFIFAIIGLIVCRGQKKKGYAEKAKSMMNAIGIGLDVKMAIVVLVMIYKFMIAAG